MLVPVNRTGLSFAAGYLGLCCLVLVPAPAALVVSVLALRDLHHRPDRAGRCRAWFGLLAGALGTLALLASLLHQAQPQPRTSTIVTLPYWLSRFSVASSRCAWHAPVDVLSAGTTFSRTLDSAQVACAPQSSHSTVMAD